MASSKDVRAWAAQRGMKVGERGRIHPDILRAYAAATGDEQSIESILKRSKPVTLGGKPSKRKVIMPQSQNNSKHRNFGNIRDWARANGYKVGERGRIDLSIVAAYDAAMSVKVTSDCSVPNVVSRDLVSSAVANETIDAEVPTQQKSSKGLVKRRSLTQGVEIQTYVVPVAAKTAKERIDSLEIALKSRGLHISQHD